MTTKRIQTITKVPTAVLRCNGATAGVSHYVMYNVVTDSYTMYTRTIKINPRIETVETVECQSDLAIEDHMRGIAPLSKWGITAINLLEWLQKYIVDQPQTVHGAAALKDYAEDSTPKLILPDTINAYDWSKLPEPRPRVWHNGKPVAYAYLGYGTSEWYVVYEGERGSHYKQYDTPLFAIEPSTPVATPPITRHAPMSDATHAAILAKLAIVACGHAKIWLATRVNEISKGRTSQLGYLDETEGTSFYMDLLAMRLVNKYALKNLRDTARMLYTGGDRGDYEAAENLRRICRQVSKYRTPFAECLTQNEARAAIAILNGRPTSLTPDKAAEWQAYHEKMSK